jgi:hypothetical protein
MNCQLSAFAWLAAGAFLILSGCRSGEKILNTPPAPLPVQQMSPVPPAELPAFDKEKAENYKRALLFVQTMEMLQKNYVSQKELNL